MATRKSVHNISDLRLFENNICIEDFFNSPCISVSRKDLTETLYILRDMVEKRLTDDMSLFVKYYIYAEEDDSDEDSEVELEEGRNVDTDMLEEDSLAVAETLWLEDELHAGLIALQPADLFDSTVAQYLTKTLTNDWRRHTDQELDRLSTWLCSFVKKSKIPMSPDSLAQLRPFTDYCKMRGFHELAVLVAFIAGDWDLVRELVRLGPGTKLHKKCSIRILQLLTPQAEAGIICDVFRHHFGLDGLRCLRLDVELLTDWERDDMAELCEQGGQEAWAVMLRSWRPYIQLDDSFNAISDPENCSLALLFKVVYGFWKNVRRWLRRCSHHELVLHIVFVYAMMFADVGIVRLLLPKVHLQGLRLAISISMMPQHGGIVISSLKVNPVFQLLSWATCSGSCEKAGQLTSLLCRQGLASHLECDAEDLLYDALLLKRTCVCKRLWQFGVVSAATCRAVCRSQRVKDLTASNPAVQIAVSKLTAFLDSRTSSVRSLQELCRLQVSHELGFGGRRDIRIQALGTTRPAMDMISFEDLSRKSRRRRRER